MLNSMSTTFYGLVHADLVLSNHLVSAPPPPVQSIPAFRLRFVQCALPFSSHPILPRFLTRIHRACPNNACQNQSCRVIQRLFCSIFIHCNQHARLDRLSVDNLNANQQVLLALHFTLSPVYVSPCAATANPLEQDEQDGLGITSLLRGNEESVNMSGFSGFWISFVSTTLAHWISPVVKMSNEKSRQDGMR